MMASIAETQLDVAPSSKSKVRSTEDERAECRAFLRERFLRSISGFVGLQCKIATIENTTITAHYHGMDMHGQDIFVKNLTTPMGQLRYALVRTMDVVNMKLVNVPLANQE